MATFKICVQRISENGPSALYIRVTHNRKVGYIKTGKHVIREFIKKNKEIKDPYLLSYCSNLINQFVDALNHQDISKWSLTDVISFIENQRSDISFSLYARKYIRQLINEGRERTAKNYKLALSHFECYMCSNEIMFSRLTSRNVTMWIKTLSNTHRAKEMYPVCIRQIFKSAVEEYNDYDNQIIRIKTNPWIKVQIPECDRSMQRAISAEACRTFFATPIPESKLISPVTELAHDVAKMVLCLAGINTIDLYNLKKNDYKNQIISYERAKTRASRKDNAYFEIRVEKILIPLMEKYKSDSDDEYLFNFHKRFSTPDSFGANVNRGLKPICKAIGLDKTEMYSIYTFRHTWATIAQNDCGASISDVGFALNHAHGQQVTRTYVKIDYSPAWELNKKVIDFVFFSNKKSKLGSAEDIDNPSKKSFKLSPKRMVYARAYLRGEVVAEKTDIGYSNVEQVLNDIYPLLPASIPERCEVTFRIKDIDTGNEAIYTRTKGKSF